MKALVLNNIVVQICQDTFEVHPNLQWHDCSEEVNTGWVLKENGTFEQPIQIITWDDIRQARNNKLLETDWIIIKHQEQGTAIPAEWATYRQSLRDITTSFSTPDSVVWPVKPS